MNSWHATMVYTYMHKEERYRYNTLYKKRLQFSRTQPGCHLPNSPWLGIIKLFLARESLVCDIPAGDGKTVNLSLQCAVRYMLVVDRGSSSLCKFLSTELIDILKGHGNDSPSRGVVFRIRISPRIRSQKRNGSKGSVRDLWGTNFCKNPRKSAWSPCPFNTAHSIQYCHFTCISILLTVNTYLLHT
jgi:hypothetical protein